MSLKWLLGGEVNHKFIAKQKHKSIEFEQELDSGVLKKWKLATNPLEKRIIKIIENWKDSDSDFPRRFFLRHPELLTSDQKVYATILLPTMSEADKNKNCYNFFIKSDSDIKVKINNILKATANSNDKDFARRFFIKYPELVPPELNPFLKENKNNELQLKKELLDKEKEILELKLKLAQLEKK